MPIAPYCFVACTTSRRTTAKWRRWTLRLASQGCLRTAVGTTAGPRGYITRTMHASVIGCLHWWSPRCVCVHPRR